MFSVICLTEVVGPRKILVIGYAGKWVIEDQRQVDPTTAQSSRSSVISRQRARSWFANDQIINLSPHQISSPILGAVAKFHYYELQEVLVISRTSLGIET